MKKDETTEGLSILEQFGKGGDILAIIGQPYVSRCWAKLKW